MSIDAMKQALEALSTARQRVQYMINNGEWYTPEKVVDQADEAITSLRAAIKSAEKQEPVAWLNKKISYMSVLTKPDDGGGWFPVFTTPQPAIPAGWQPIETAPKDGSDFLAYNPMTRKHVVVFWKHDAWIFPELVFSSSITHWMPLPAAPKQENSHD